MALLLLARRVFPGLLALHVDHGTRDGGSSRDAAWLRRRCRLLGIPIAVKKLRVGAGSAFEARARAARYAAFESMARAGGITHLLLAHHADDQAETVALRLRRGSGVRGLAAMQARRITPSGLVLCRPFLAARREELRSALAELGASWREDPTNALPITARNILRANLGGSEQAHQQLLSVARSARALQRRALASVRKALPARSIVRAPGFVAARTAPVRAVPSALHAALLEHLLGRDAPLMRRDHAAFTKALSGVVARTALSGGWRLELDAEWLMLLAPAAWTLPVAVRGGAVGHAGGPQMPARRALLRFTLRLLKSQRAVTRALAVARKEPSAAVLTLAPDRIRYFRAAARYRPLGARGSKLLSDALRERGIPRLIRNAWPLLGDGAGFLWAPGLVPAERARVLSAPAWAVQCGGPFKVFVRSAQRT